MKRFTALIARLECAGNEARRIDALREYLAEAPPGDAAWAVRLVAGHGLGRLLRAETLCESVRRTADVEPWLFDTCLEASGDIAETIAHLLPPAVCTESMALAPWIEDRLLPLRGWPMPQACDQALQGCATLDAAGRELLVRLMLGRWRAIVAESVLLQALSQHANIDIRLLRLRWLEWLGPVRRPHANPLTALLRPQPTHAEARAQAFPFAAAQVVDASALSFAELAGGRGAWVMRDRHGTCRVQLVRRAAGVWLWSSSGELLNRRCADILEAATALPVDTVLEGELADASAERLVDRAESSPEPEKPAVRRRSTRQLLRASEPGFDVSDLLELGGLDLRDRPYAERLACARDLPLPPPIVQSPEIGVDEGASPTPLLTRCAARGQRGWLALRRDAPYGATHALLHLRPPPMKATAALRTAQWAVDRDGVSRLELGLALWNERPRDQAGLEAALEAMATGARLPADRQQLVPLAKVHLDPPLPGDAADRHADGLLEWIQEATLQRFGPVRLLRPGRVCEIAFDGLEPSGRRKSGVSLTAVRLQRWRSDCGLMDVDDVQRLRALLASDVSTDTSS